MPRQLVVISILITIVIACSFFTRRPLTPAQQTKQFYLQQLQQLQKEIVLLKKQVVSGDEKKLQQQFIQLRAAYKPIEAIVEYYFNFHAVKLNGPPIIFYEEDEPDLGEQQPGGMQVIEGLLFPHYDIRNRKKITQYIQSLYRYSKELEQTNESFAFTDEYIFDAVIEELYRITALGIAGFDAQSSGNGLAESRAALNGVEKILSFYTIPLSSKLGAGAQLIFSHLKNARQYLQLHSDFNTFDRMQFIKTCLDPLTKLVGEYKLLNDFNDNPSPMFYSALKKNGSLFKATAFDVNKFLDDNTTSKYKIELGRKLFFDTQLSAGNNRSCASCHQPGKAFTDGLTTSLQLDGHTPLPRNAPTLWNVALQRSLFLDNRSASLEDQAMQVLNNEKEMNGSATAAAEKIIAETYYSDLYAKAYPSAAKETAAQNTCNAIACYLRTLIALNARFDQYMRGEAELKKNEINGFNLFMGKAKCGTCHFMPLFNGAKPPRYYYIETEVVGTPAKGIAGKQQLDNDLGRFTITGLPVHKHSFKTQTLRNIQLTAPYMHNGVFNTLEEVIDFYDKGGGKGLGIAPVNQSLPFDKLLLSKKEKKDILSFLNCLTDTSGRY